MRRLGVLLPAALAIYGAYVMWNALARMTYYNYARGAPGPGFLPFWLALGLIILGLILTIALGLIFISLQAFEYAHAYSAMNLKLTTGIYGTTFFMLTGFHGFHVTMGAIMLTVILIRCMAGHFRPDRHFAFEAVSWYWHFVDVVWLALFIFVYWI